VGKQLVTIIGNVGVGKTTSLPLVAKALNADIIRADELFQVNPFRDHFLKDTPRWGFTSELWLVYQRVQLIKQSIEKSQKDIIVIDSGLIMSWVYAKSHFLTGKMRLDEWLFFEELFKEFSSFSLNTTLLYLSAPVDTLLLRIKKRKRDYEIALYKKEYIQQLELGLRDLCASLSYQFDDIIFFPTEHIGNIVSSSMDKASFVRSIQEKWKYSRLLVGRKQGSLK
jgi:deoxyadenosine/deoxycytidine kinase